MRRKLAEAATRRIQGILEGPSKTPVTSAIGAAGNDQDRTPVTSASVPLGQSAAGNDARLLGRPDEAPEAGTSRQVGEDDDDWLMELDDWGKQDGMVGQIVDGQEQHRGPPEIDKSLSSGGMNMSGSRGKSNVQEVEEQRLHGEVDGAVRTAGEVVACPICNRTFQGMSNVELNVHIDSCLNQQGVIVLE